MWEGMQAPETRLKSIRKVQNGQVQHNYTSTCRFHRIRRYDRDFAAGQLGAGRGDRVVLPDELPETLLAALDAWLAAQAAADAKVPARRSVSLRLRVLSVL